MIHFKNILAGIGLVATTAVCVQAVQQDDDTQRIDPEIKKTDKLVNDYNVYAIPLPETLDFAGEPVPLDNPDIRERLDRELLVNTYWQSNGLLLIKRAAKYFPIIEPILEEEGLPDDFKYLAVIESGLTQAVSPARATGFWQILRSTGRELGLEVNDNVDERYNIELSTRAACRYLKNSKENLGSWTLAAAGYNAGNAGMSRRLDQQNVNGYYDLLLGDTAIKSNAKNVYYSIEDSDLKCFKKSKKILNSKKISTKSGLLRKKVKKLYKNYDYIKKK